jgi:hypothetical protein
MQSRQIRETAGLRGRLRAGWLGVLLAAVTGGGAFAAPPELYWRPDYQSPVRGGPDELLLLAGYGLSAGDSVVYRALQDSTSHPQRPQRLPATSTWRSGRASVVSTANVPYSITIRLPGVVRARQDYVLWIRTLGRKWSRAISINDARPLWITPPYVYATEMPAGLPRQLKLVGRNLERAPGELTRLRLTGPTTITLSARSYASSTMNRYVARVQLPAVLSRGRYSIAVSRDGLSWVALRGQTLSVLADPPRPRLYDVSSPRFGGCRPDDGRDDAHCIAEAVAAAAAHGGGTVELGPGTWILRDLGFKGLQGAGIVLPPNVNLDGAGPTLTIVIRAAKWSAAAPGFTLTRRNSVSGFTFRDARHFTPTDRGTAFIQLGSAPSTGSDVTSRDVPDVSDVIVTRNDFHQTYEAIRAGGSPITRLFLTHNLFGAYRLDLALSGSRFAVNTPFRIDDSVIDHNLFEPSSFLDLRRRTGSTASDLGAADRLDFSDNLADGSTSRQLYSRKDAGGWRGAFFWSLHNNVERMLVSRNDVTCAGDKIADGEAIALDNNANTFAFDDMRHIVRADRSSVTVRGPLLAQQDDRSVNVADYYVGHWIQVGDGPGVGQARRITRYRLYPHTGLVTLDVTPEWDVVPVRGRTRVSVGREYWQVFVLSNRVDQRAPPCLKSNRSRSAGGGIVLWAQTADTVVAGNRQFDTDGILVQQSYRPPRQRCKYCSAETFYQTFLSIRDNLIHGEYDWALDCSASGIQLASSAAPWGSIPPVLGYGISIAGNTVLRADGEFGGGLSIFQDWYAGPPPHRWPLLDNLLVFHNTFENISGRPAVASCVPSHPRVGIAFAGAGLAWHTVLYANSCRATPGGIALGGVDTVRACSSARKDCECRSGR